VGNTFGGGRFTAEGAENAEIYNSKNKKPLSQDWERDRVRVGILGSGFRRNDNEKPSLSHLVTPAKAGVQFSVRKNPSFHFRHFFSYPAHDEARNRENFSIPASKMGRSAA
jgi:hypothetical protein